MGVERKKFRIPNQIDKSFHLWRSITLVDVLILSPFLSLSVILFIYVFTSDMMSLYFRVTFSAMPSVFAATLVFVRPMRERSNIKLFHLLKWRMEFNQRQKRYLYKKKIYQ